MGVSSQMGFLFVVSVVLFFIILQQWEFASCAHAGSSFVKRKGRNFVVNGSHLYVNGFNSYWLMIVATDPRDRQNVTSAFQHAAAHGMTVARTWAFNDGNTYRALQTSPGVYDEQVFQALDFVVCEAKKHGIRVILSLVNNYKDYGGRPQYVQWGREAGLNITSDDDFYTNPTVKGFYRNHAKTVMTRVNSMNGIAYRNDSTIFAWELINEPRCQTDTSGKTLKKWIREMAEYVKSIDRNHLVEVGMEGFYGSSTPEKVNQTNPGGYEVGTDFITNNKIRVIDFATVHSYPDAWLAGFDDDAQLSFLKKWMQTHLEDAGKILKKPVLFAEFGKSYTDPGYSTAQRDRFFCEVYENIFAAACSGRSGGGGLFWQLLVKGLDSLADGYDIVLSESPSTTAIISSQSDRLSALSRRKFGSDPERCMHLTMTIQANRCVAQK